MTVIDSQQLRAMSALRTRPAPALRVATPYSFDVARVAHFLLHKCKEHIAVGARVMQIQLKQMTWDDVFVFATEEIYGFSEGGQPALILHLADGRTLDVCGLLNDFKECTHYRVC
ncbi:MAG: hypothetical protein K2Z80_08750 [Xanthobacteraceae bacterium]|nr:hypothetical protein [Xanthobacteraceae bacterium]